MDEGSVATGVVVRFNDCINRRDLDGLSALMSDDHTFVDSAGAAVAGRDVCREAWQGFFAAYPDYRNVFTSMSVVGDVVTVVGYSVCADPLLAGPAVWTATISGGRVRIWQVSEPGSTTAG
jgi:ketosteroid isomerase-like protein